MVSRSNFGPNYYSPSPSADFAPRFIIVDKVTNAVKDFTGSYVLRAIATGLTPDSMVPFTDRERAVYNPGEG